MGTTTARIAQLTQDSLSNPITQPGDAAAMLAEELKAAIATINQRNADDVRFYNQKCDDVNFAVQNGENFDAAGWWPKVPMAWELGPKEGPFNYQYPQIGTSPVCAPRTMWEPTPPNPPGTIVFGNVEANGTIVGADKSDTWPAGVTVGPMPGPPDGLPHRYLKFNWVGMGSKYMILPPA